MHKVTLFFSIVALVLVAIIALFMVNERDIAGVLLYPLARLPITLFNLVTGSAFAPHDCGFLCFPTLPQVLFILIFDIILIYLIACAIALFHKKGSQGQTQNGTF